MAKKRTLPENIRRYKQEYLRLGVLEAKLNHQLYRMKKRIKRLVAEEELRLNEKVLLREQLQQVQQQKTELESQPASKKRDTQLKRVIKEYKKVKARHSRNQYQLDTLEVKKDKDNVAKLLLKEARRDDVRIRLKAAYETWMYLEQMQQYELAQQSEIQAKDSDRLGCVNTELTVDKPPVSTHKSRVCLDIRFSENAGNSGHLQTFGIGTELRFLSEPEQNSIALVSSPVLIDQVLPV